MKNENSSGLVIKPRHVSHILGVCLKTAATKIKMLKSKLKKEKEQFLSVKEFCNFFGLNFNDVRDEMRRVDLRLTPKRS